MRTTRPRHAAISQAPQPLKHSVNTPATGGKRVTNTKSGVHDPLPTREESPVSKTAADVLSLVAAQGFEFVDLRFCALPGQVQHFTVPVKQLTEDSFEAGFGFDGSSIRGFQQIHESDM